MFKNTRKRLEDLKQKIAGAISKDKQSSAVINSSPDLLESIPLNTPPSPERDAANSVFSILVEDDTADLNQQTAASSGVNDGGRARSDSTSSEELEDEYIFTARILEPNAAVDGAPKNIAAPTCSDPILSSAPVELNSPALIVQAYADDSDQPLAAAQVSAPRQNARALRGAGGGGLDGYLQAIETPRVSEFTKLSASRFFKYCQDNPKQTAAVALAAVATGAFAATGVAIGAMALGAEAAVTATASVFTGLLTSASASAAVVKANKPEIIEHVAIQEEKVRQGLIQQELEIADALRKQDDMANEDVDEVIFKIAMCFVGGGEQMPYTHDQTDEWLLKHGQTAKAWLKAYVAAYHNIFENTDAQDNIAQLVCGILDKSKLEELGIKKSDITTIECGWHHNFCETPTKMAAWLCADEGQQHELVRSMDEYNSHVRDKAEAAIAETLLAEIKASQLQGENGEHNTQLAGGNDDAKEE